MQRPSVFSGPGGGHASEDYVRSPHLPEGMQCGYAVGQMREVERVPAADQANHASE